MVRSGPKALSLPAVRTACRSYTSLVMAAPSAELEAGPAEYRLRVALPGVVRHTISVWAKEDTLVLSGAWEGVGPDAAVLFGNVYRAVLLPDDAVPGLLEVRLAAGTLLVTVPRRPL